MQRRCPEAHQQLAEQVVGEGGGGVVVLLPVAHSVVIGRGQHVLTGHRAVRALPRVPILRPSKQLVSVADTTLTSLWEYEDSPQPIDKRKAQSALEIQAWGVLW